MNIKKAIFKRRAYRSLVPIEISEELIYDLAECAQLSASCFNNQPWRYIFVHNSEVLNQMSNALSLGNEWAREASMIIVVFSKKEDDCVIHDREYYLFDTGMATGFIILRATELGFVAHPIAGFSPKKIKKILGIPDAYEVITLIIVGKHAKKISQILSNNQVEAEKNRPKRLHLDEFVYINKYKEK
jgi:nitroreductase